MKLSKLRDRKRLLTPLLLVGLILLVCVVGLWLVSLRPTDQEIVQKIFRKDIVQKLFVFGGNDIKVQYKSSIPCPQLPDPINDYCAQASNLLENWFPKRIIYLESDQPLPNPAAFSEIGQLKNLGILVLTSNGLTSLPPEIGQLQNLQILYLSGNQLTSLPPEIGQLQNLRELGLDYNQLISLPPEIGQLQNLQRLYLSGNKLTSLPPKIGQLQNLQSLDLSGNPLTDLPPEVEQLPGLEIHR